MKDDRGRVRIHIRGIVQGVGFRPFVYRLAHRYGLTGWVSNSRRGVEIEAEGTEEARRRFIDEIAHHHPPLARIEAMVVEPIPPDGSTEFVIRPSEEEPAEALAPISPDVAICEECLRELFDPSDRRYLYPFINCTHCGPRFTIIRGVPYDRPRTTMAGFPMCADCRAEYEDPTNRRFHAQPIACPACGPQAVLRRADGRPVETDDPLADARRWLAAGRIVAVKGLGGYHLACDARNAEVCRALRSRRVREEKPFAVMVRDLATAHRLGVLDAEAEALLRSPISPIVIVPKADGYDLAPDVAPATRTVGLMLPYTPLHHLLFHASPLDVLVMTSGNRSDEPICYTEEDAFARLGDIADGFLTHNRPIYVRCDDSVVRWTSRGPMLIRRARGYAPEAVGLPEPLRAPMLACGAELKHTFCIGKGERAYVSHHIGDLENEATWKAFTEGVEHYTRLFEIEPAYVAHDLHPDYLSTRYAESLGLPKIGVQHHHAHIAACLADNGRTGPVVGLAFDGTGYGEDGTIWGGEWFIADLGSFRRVASLRPLHLPGGEKAIRQPWRLAAYVLRECFGDAWEQWGLPLMRWVDPSTWSLLKAALVRKVNCPETSAVGRLFDAIAALSGVRGRISYEAQAPIEFEQMADRSANGAYPFPSVAEGNLLRLDWRPAVEGIVHDLRSGASAGAVSMRFHRGLAEGVAALTARLAGESGLDVVALSGGVFQNVLFTDLLVPALEARGLRVLLHRRVPPNDGGISLGQLVVANRRIDG